MLKITTAQTMDEQAYINNQEIQHEVISMMNQMTQIFNKLSGGNDQQAKAAMQAREALSSLYGSLNPAPGSLPEQNLAPSPTTHEPGNEPYQYGEGLSLR